MKNKKVITFVLATFATVIYLAITVNDIVERETEYGGWQILRLVAGLTFLGLMWYNIIKNNKNKEL